jgi:hypothetical protein
MCIARFDHHCVWVNQCVGRGNYHYFVTFLAVHVFMCCYGTYLLAAMLWDIVVQQRLFSATFVDRLGNQHSANLTIVIQYLLHKYMVVIALLLLAVTMGIALGGFLGYHLNLIAKNRTTNESSKLSDLEHHLERLLKEMKEAEKVAKKTDGDKPKAEDVQPTSSSVPEAKSSSNNATTQNGNSKKGKKKKDSKPTTTPQQDPDERTIELSPRTVGISKTFYNLGFSANFKQVFS